MAAYFNYINSRKGTDGKRGVYGRQIIWKYYDDEYNPAQTVQLTNQLVLRTRSSRSSARSEPSTTSRSGRILNQRKIPQILISTGASYWGLEYKKFPWTIGWQPDYIAEGRVYGQWIAKNAPNAKIAIFYQNDDYGKDYLKGLEAGPRGEEEPDRVEGALRGHGHELRVADRAPEASGARHVGALHDADADREGDRHGEGAQLEAGHDHDQLRRRERRRHDGAEDQRGAAYTTATISDGVPEEPDEPEVREGSDTMVKKY